MLPASSYTIMLSDNEMALPNIIISKGVLKCFTFSWGVGGRGIFTKILWDGHFGKWVQGSIQYDPKTGRGWGVEWPIDPLSEGNICESFEYILLLRETGSVLP